MGRQRQAGRSKRGQLMGPKRTGMKDRHSERTCGLGGDEERQVRHSERTEG